MAVSLLDHRGRVMKTIHTDAHDDNRFVEVMHEDVSPIIEMAKSLALVRSMARAKAREKQTGMRLVGFMPDTQVEKMMREGSWNDPQALRRWFNDSQNKDFRVWHGRI